MVEALQTINVWVGRGAQMSSDESPLNPTPPYVPSDPFNEEMKAVQERWHEIDINNSWEMLLLQSPPSIKALGELMVLSLTPSNRSSVCIGEGISLRAPRYHLGGAGYLQTLLAQAVNEGRIAQQNAHQSMAAIAENMNQIPRSIEVILELLNQHSSEQIRFQLPAQVNKIRCTVEDSIKNSHSLELHFHKAMRLMNDRRKSIGRAGFELLGEVKLFWSSVISFCEELNKLIHYTLDSSTNAFNSILRTQYEIAQKQNKFSLKRKTREEIYHSSLAIIAYAWAVRHLANAYIHYSSQFIMPQINVIARYPLIATNKIEFAKAQQQFRELNMACEQETNKMVGINSTESKRRSILKMDMGLNLNLNEIGRDIDEIIQPVAEFRTGKLQFNHEFELDNQERSMMLTNERRSREEQKNKLKMEKKRVKEEETIKKERHKREKEEVEKRLKEENKRIKEETKKRKQQEREQRKQLDRSNSERKASWNRSSSTRSGSPQSPQSLQFDLSLPSRQVQNYYPEPQPNESSANPSYYTQTSSISQEHSQMSSPVSRPSVMQSSVVYENLPHPNNNQTRSAPIALLQKSPDPTVPPARSPDSTTPFAKSPDPTVSLYHSPTLDLSSLESPESTLSPAPRAVQSRSSETPQTPQSTQFPMSPQKPPTPQSTYTTTKTIQIPSPNQQQRQQFFQYPQTNPNVDRKTQHQASSNSPTMTEQFGQIAEYIDGSQRFSSSPQPTITYQQYRMQKYPATARATVQSTAVPLQTVTQQQQQQHQPYPQFDSIRLASNSWNDSAKTAQNDTSDLGQPINAQPIHSSTPLHSPDDPQQPVCRQRATVRPVVRERPISYPTNFRQSEFHSPQADPQSPFYDCRNHHPFYGSCYHVVDETIYTDEQYPDSTHLTHNPAIFEPQSNQAAKPAGFIARLRASLMRKPKKTPVNKDEEEQIVELPKNA